MNNSRKYAINNEETVNRLGFLRDGLIKFESLYHKIVFYSENDGEIFLRRNRSDVSISVNTNDSINFESFNSSTKLSDFIQSLNVGNLIPLKCGHSGVLDNKELETYQLYLFKAKLIN